MLTHAARATHATHARLATHATHAAHAANTHTHMQLIRAAGLPRAAKSYQLLLGAATSCHHLPHHPAQALPPPHTPTSPHPAAP